MKNGQIEKFKEYIHSTFDYENKIDEYIRSYKEVEGEGYLVFSDDFINFKNKIKYKYCKHFSSLKDDKELISLFDINSYEQIKKLEPIEIKSADYIKSIILYINCNLITKELFNIISIKKGKTVKFKVKNKLITLFLNNNEQLKLTHTKFLFDPKSLNINDSNYEDELGFCKSATLEEVKENDYALTPGRYVGTPEDEGDGIPFEEKMKTLTSELSEQLKEEEALNKELKKVLGAIGYDI